MKKIIVTSVILFICSMAFTQNMVLNDPVSSRTFSSEKYSTIKGSPFLFDKWMTGTAWVSKGYYSKIELKLDLYGNTLYFSKDDELYEFVDNVTAFILMPDVSDSSSYLHFTKGLTGPSLKSDQYVQVIMEGKIRLYRSDIKLLSEVNEINAGVVKSFTTSSRYYVLKDGNLQLIRLNKKEVFDLIKDKEEKIQLYINENKLSTKKDSDLILILKHYNSL